MPPKQISIVENSEKKVVKKKSGLSKAKKVSSKKTVKKISSSSTAAKKKIKAKSASKGTKLKSGAKTVKRKVTRVHSAKSKTAKKAVSERKKSVKKRQEKPVIKEEQSRGETDEALKSPSIISRSKSKLSEQDAGDVKRSAHSPTPKESKTVLKEPVESAHKPKVLENKYEGTILINELITVRELADKMKSRVGDVLKKLLSMGSIATINQRLDSDTAILLANEFGYDAKFASIYSEEKIDTEEEDDSKLKTRPPIVTIMGHVDHGKTSLLDAIRNSNVVAGEHGGITQHIGAYKVKTSDGRYIVFLDTPGHEAFTAMRSRGAQITDIVVLVVSATDGVMPQTVEAVNHAKAANVPIVVAVNKIDLPTSDPQKVRKELNNYGLVPEEWGGDTIVIDISAKQKTNINSLLEMILLKAEMMELKANPCNSAKGVVVEAKLDSRRGPVATLLVHSGTLKVGDNLVVGTTYGRVRAMSDEYGKRFSEAPPSTPVEILGVNEPPQAGDEFIVVSRESQAREIVQSRKEKVKEAYLKPVRHLSLADINLGRTKDLRIILKADAQGSLGALSDALERLSTSEINLKIIHKGAGAITESDVALAVASDALIVGFNLRPDAAVEKLIEDEGVNVNIYRVIYDLIADVKAAMEGLLEPAMSEKILGKAVVKKVFKLSTHGTILGCSVIEGRMQRGAKARLLRDNAIVFEGNISSLKRFKDDVKEVEKGYECGISLENFSDVKQEDIIENYIAEKIARKLDGN